MGILDKLSNAGKTVSDKTKNVSDASNLKNKILYEEERIVEIFAEIGQRYYKDRNGDTSKLEALCDDINTRRKRIAKMKLEYHQLKGVKVCPKCGTRTTDKNAFCGKCGTALPDAENISLSALDIEGFYDED